LVSICRSLHRSRLKSHLIAFPSLEKTAASTRTFIQLEYNEYTNHINRKKMSLCLIASK
jgi:hypothetical protein